MRGEGGGGRGGYRKGRMFLTENDDIDAWMMASPCRCDFLFFSQVNARWTSRGKEVVDQRFRRVGLRAGCMTARA